MKNPGRLPDHRVLDEPLLSFSPEHLHRHSHPLVGLIENGPYTAKSLTAYTPQIRVAIVGPASGADGRRALLRSLRDETAYIGLAYALRGDPADAHFVTCCSQVFDSDGGGMQFVAYDARDPLATGTGSQQTQRTAGSLTSATLVCSMSKRG